MPILDRIVVLVVDLRDSLRERRCVSKSHLELQMERQRQVLDDLERSSKNLLSETFALVQAVGDDASILDSLRDRAAAARGRLRKILQDERILLPAVAANQAWTLLERLHEAALELDLAATLGGADPLGQDALHRARHAVARDGRALFRGLGQIVAGLREEG